MMIDREAYAAELIERLGVWTKECTLKIAEAFAFAVDPIPREAVSRGLEAAARRLVLEYPLTDETLEGWEEFYARKPSLTHIFDRLLREELAGQEAAEAVAMAAAAGKEKASDYAEGDLALKKLQSMRMLFAGRKKGQGTGGA